MAAEKKKKKNITMVMEDYLEAIYELGLEKKVVRVRDIATKLSVKMPTVTSMLKSLSDRGLVNYEKYEYVELTKQGKDVGVEMHRRHDVLRRFLNEILKIDNKTADDEACKMEHALSASTLDRLIKFMSFIYDCPRTGESWLEHFDDYRAHGPTGHGCGGDVEGFVCEFKKRIAQKDSGQEDK